MTLSDLAVSARRQLGRRAAYVVDTGHRQPAASPLKLGKARFDCADEGPNEHSFLSIQGPTLINGLVRGLGLNRSYGFVTAE